MPVRLRMVERLRADGITIWRCWKPSHACRAICSWTRPLVNQAYEDTSLPIWHLGQTISKPSVVGTMFKVVVRAASIDVTASLTWLVHWGPA